MVSLKIPSSVEHIIGNFFVVFNVVFHGAIDAESFVNI